MKILSINIFLFLICFALQAQSYSFDQQLISTAGQVGSAGGIELSYSIGEPIVTTVTSDSYTFTQGFQQPLNDSTIKPETLSPLYIYNGLTPNGDENNDFWLIERIEQSSPNNINIFDRMGKLVWNTTNYDNISRVWKGQMNNDKILPAGTYFYTIEYTNNKSTKTLEGWVQLIK